MIFKRFIFYSVVMLLFCPLQVHGQPGQLTLHEMLYSASTLKEWNIADTSLLQAFYKGQNEDLYWQKPIPANARTQILQLVEKSEEYGLNKSDYHFDEMEMLLKDMKTAIDSIKADIVFTDGLLHFLCDLHYGHRPTLEYNGLKALPDKQVLIGLLLQWIETGDRVRFLNGLEPETVEYKSIKALWRQYNARVSEKGYSEDSIVFNKVSITNKPLLIKLFRLGVLDTTRPVTDKALDVAIKKIQRQFNLVPDGKVGSLTLNALNVSLYQRAEALKAALNDLRWLQRLSNDSIAVVNIPSATLYVYGKGELILGSRLVVGKKSTPTPTLSSYIHEVILYPYWNVPFSIATKELLPKIKQNRGFLAANNFQVLSMKGKVLDPGTINWKSLSDTNFPYLIRQSTGCDNSLGLVKFNFFNPFSVYLHDTPSKGLFALQKRYFSHGCVRVEHPVALAELLLQEEKERVKELTEQCLRDQKPLVFSLKKPMPVVVLYNTAWYDFKGNVSFYDNVYGK